MTADQAADVWPADEPRCIQSIRNAFARLARRGVVTRSGLHTQPVYNYEPQAERVIQRTPMEVKWAAFRLNPQGYLDSLTTTKE